MVVEVSLAESMPVILQRLGAMKDPTAGVTHA